MVQHLKNFEHAKCIDFQFHNLKFSQEGFLDFHVTTATVDLCMKEVIDSENYGHTKSKILNCHCTKFSQKLFLLTILSYLEDPL